MRTHVFATGFCCLVACGGPATPTWTVSMTAPKWSVATGSAAVITATAVPVGGATEVPTLRWTVSDPAILGVAPTEGDTVNVTGLAPGTAIVTVTAFFDGVATKSTNSQPFKVVAGRSVQIENAENRAYYDVTPGEAMHLAASASGDGLGSYAIQWRSSNPAVATISPAQGTSATAAPGEFWVLEGVSVGDATITATLVEGGDVTDFVGFIRVGVHASAARVSTVRFGPIPAAQWEGQEFEFFVLLLDGQQQATPLASGEEVHVTVEGLAEPTRLADQEGTIRYRTTVTASSGTASVVATWTAAGATVKSEKTLISASPAPTYGFAIARQPGAMQGPLCDPMAIPSTVGDRLRIVPARVHLGECTALEIRDVTWHFGAGLIDDPQDKQDSGWQTNVFMAKAGTSPLSFTFEGHDSVSLEIAVAPHAVLVEPTPTPTSCTVVSAVQLSLSGTKQKQLFAREIREQTPQLPVKDVTPDPKNDPVVNCTAPAGLVANGWQSADPSRVRVDVDGADPTAATLVALTTGVDTKITAGAASATVTTIP